MKARIIKKVSILIAVLLCTLIGYTQTPQGFNYQAVVRNSNGTPLANQTVSVKITLQSYSGTIYFSESKSIGTNAQGVLNHIVGTGTLVLGDLSTIPWSSGDVYLKVEIDPNGGTSYTQMGNPAKFQSVPYALFAEAGNQGAPGADGNGVSSVVDNGDGTLTFNFTDGSSYKTPNLKGDKGDKGDAGTGLNNRGNWVTGTTYNPGDYVFATNSSETGNSMWIVQAAAAFSSSTEPRLDPTNWIEFQSPRGEKGEPGDSGISIVWLGSFPGVPTSYALNNAYYNSTDKKSYVYTATGWQQMTQDGIPISGTTGQTLYYNGTTWVASSVLINDGTNLGVGTNPTQKLDVNGNTRLRGSLYDYNNSAGVTNDLLVNNGNGLQWKSISNSGIASGTGTLGQVALWSGTNSLQGITNLSWGTTSLQIVSPTTAGTDDPILEVKNKDGKVVFGVYQGGVRIYVEDSQITKGVRGGFAVGGLTNQSKGQQEYFRITPDSARIYVKENPTVKGVRGGFAVGGLTNQSKTVTNRDLMFIAPDSARIYIDETSTKGVRGGFAIGGLTNQSKGVAYNLLSISKDSARIYIDNSTTKGVRGGFAVGGLTNQSKGTNNDYFNISASSTAEVIKNESRVMWYPTKSALLAGNLNIPSADSVGQYSMSLGYRNIARGNWSQAMGYQSVARGPYSTAIGYQAVADTSSFSFGYGSKALGYNSFAFGGRGVDAAGNIQSTVTTAKGKYSFAFGLGSVAKGLGSFVLGINCEASGKFATATGFSSKASGLNSTSMGVNNESSGEVSFTMGSGNKATAQYSFAFGANNTANGIASLALGLGNTISTSGLYAIVGGTQNTAAGASSFAMGSYNNATGDGSIAVGTSNTTTGVNSAAFGEGNTSGGTNSFAIGTSTIASSGNSLAMGNGSQANASNSLAMGNGAKTTGSNSIAAGYNTTAQAYASLVIGRFNTVSGTTGNWVSTEPLFVAGNGTNASTTSNALILYKNGNMTIAGTLTQNSDSRLKNNIVFLENVLGLINKIHPIYFDFIDKTTHPSKRQIGFVAQEIKPLFPELVEEDSQGYLSVDYSKISVVLLQAIQEQQIIIQEQKEKNVELENQIVEINKKLKELEEKIK